MALIKFNATKGLQFTPNFQGDKLSSVIFEKGLAVLKKLVKEGSIYTTDEFIHVIMKNGDTRYLRFEQSPIICFDLMDLLNKKVSPKPVLLIENKFKKDI